MSSKMKQLFSPFLNALFPPFCAWCHKKTGPGLTTLCTSCLKQLSLLDTKNRCPSCFTHLEKGSHRCQHNNIKTLAFCFEDSPLCSSLFHVTERPHPLASFFIFQLEKLNWPMPDCILPTPGDWFLGRKWRSVQALASSVATFLQRPYLPLYLDRLHLREPLLSVKTRTTQAFYLKNAQKIVNRKVLIVGNGRDSKEELSLSAKALRNYGALEVRVLGGVYSE